MDRLGLSSNTSPAAVGSGSSRGAAPRTHHPAAATHPRTNQAAASPLCRAVPLDLLKTEQDRIADRLETTDGRLEATGAHFDTVQTNLKVALDLAGDWHRAYVQADDHTRRLLNQVFFERLYIDEDGVRATLAEPFKTLLGPEVMTVTREHSDTKAESESGQARGSTRQSTIRQDWNAAYIKHTRTQRPETNKPAPVQRGAGLKRSLWCARQDSNLQPLDP